MTKVELDVRLVSGERLTVLTAEPSRTGADVKAKLQEVSWDHGSKDVSTAERATKFIKTRKDMKELHQWTNGGRIKKLSCKSRCCTIKYSNGCPANELQLYKVCYWPTTDHDAVPYRLAAKVCKYL